MNPVSLVVYSVSDISKAKPLFAAWLGTEPYADSPYYVGFKAGNTEIGLAMGNTSGALAYADVSDIKAALASLLAAGAEKVQDVTDVANGLLVASVKTPDGATIGLRQAPGA